jgi:hypothetical protein
MLIQIHSKLRKNLGSFDKYVCQRKGHTPQLTGNRYYSSEYVRAMETAALLNLDGPWVTGAYLLIISIPQDTHVMTVQIFFCEKEIKACLEVFPRQKGQASFLMRLPNVIEMFSTLLLQGILCLLLF